MSLSFETPEGVYALMNCPLPPYKDSQGGSNVAVRLSFFDNFVADDSVANYYATASGDTPWTNHNRNASTIVCMSIGRELYIYSQDNQTIPIDRKIFKSNPTCHAFRQDSSDPALLVGLNTGEIQLVYPTRRDFCKTFNDEKSIDKTSVTCVSWVPNSPNQFVVSHSSGNFYLYDEKLVSVLTIPTYEPFKQTTSFAVFTCKTKSTRNPLYRWVFGKQLLLRTSAASLRSTDSSPPESAPGSDNGVRKLDVSVNSDSNNDISLAYLTNESGEDSAVNQFAFSPCGLFLAVATQDGYLRVILYHSMELYGYMRSYFSGILCVDWSPDSCYIVSGGQDDLVTVWSVAERSVICRFEGHRSWVSTVRFDPFLYQNNTDERTNGVSNTNRRYRIGSVGQDTMFCLWDLTEDTIRQGVEFAREAHRILNAELEASRRNSLSKSPSLGPSAPRPPSSTLGKAPLRLSLSSHTGKSNNRSKSFGGHPTPSLRSVVNFFTWNRRKSHRSNTSSVGSTQHRTRTLNRKDQSDAQRLINGDASCKDPQIRSEAFEQILFGTPMCPRRGDVPVIEPLVCTVMHQHRLTDLFFRPDTVHAVCQQGLIRCWLRPNRSKHPDSVEGSPNASDTVSPATDMSTMSPSSFPSGPPNGLPGPSVPPERCQPPHSNASTSTNRASKVSGSPATPTTVVGSPKSSCSSPSNSATPGVSNPTTIMNDGSRLYGPSAMGCNVNCSDV